MAQHAGGFLALLLETEPRRRARADAGLTGQSEGDVAVAHLAGELQDITQLPADPVRVLRGEEAAKNPQSREQPAQGDAQVVDGLLIGAVAHAADLEQHAAEALVDPGLGKLLHAFPRTTTSGLP